MRAVKVLKPIRAKYDQFWDAKRVLTMLRGWGSWQSLTVERAQRRLAALLALYGMMRPNDLFHIMRSSINIARDSLTLTLSQTKEARRGDRCVVSLDAVQDERVCVVAGMRYWLAWLAEHRIAGDAIWVTARAPHTAAKGRTVGTALLNKVLREAGIDAHFTAHSFRGAGATAMIDGGAAVEDVMTRGRWSSYGVFSKYYNRSRRAAPLASLIQEAPRARATRRS